MDLKFKAPSTWNISTTSWPQPASTSPQTIQILMIAVAETWYASHHLKSYWRLLKPASKWTVSGRKSNFTLTLVWFPNQVGLINRLSGFIHQTTNQIVLQILLTGITLRYRTDLQREIRTLHALCRFSSVSRGRTTGYAWLHVRAILA